MMDWYVSNFYRKPIVPQYVQVNKMGSIWRPFADHPTRRATESDPQEEDNVILFNKQVA